jgi:NADPH:quinone reductase-like Zn-dependent oxidoreductase
VALLGIDTVQTPIGERRRVWSELGGYVDGALLDTIVEDEIGLEDLPEGLASILAGKVRGRILVRPVATVP